MAAAAEAAAEAAAVEAAVEVSNCGKGSGKIDCGNGSRKVVGQLFDVGDTFFCTTCF